MRRSALSSLMLFGLITSAMLCCPASAEQGELIAKEAKAQINVRSLANTEADIVAAGAVGDRVEILEHSVGNDALIWYQVKLLKSGQSGWIRGDLIKILGDPAAKTAIKAASTKRSAQTKGKPSAASQSSTKNPIALAPPKPPASVKSSAPAQSSTPVKASTPSTAPASASTEQASPSASEVQPVASSTTISAFETPTYAVRIFSQSGQLRLNLFNRKTQEIALSAVPIQSKSSADGTTYSYQGEVKVTVVVPTSGQPTISAFALGETLKERSESSSSSPAKAAPTPAAPALASPIEPASPAPASPASASPTPASPAKASPAGAPAPASTP
jgi:Bacterial SH3 domain